MNLSLINLPKASTESLWMKRLTHSRCVCASRKTKEKSQQQQNIIQNNFQPYGSCDRARPSHSTTFSFMPDNRCFRGFCSAVSPQQELYFPMRNKKFIKSSPQKPTAEREASGDYGRQTMTLRWSHLCGCFGFMANFLRLLSEEKEFWEFSSNSRIFLFNSIDSLMKRIDPPKIQVPRFVQVSSKCFSKAPHRTNEKRILLFEVPREALLINIWPNIRHRWVKNPLANRRLFLSRM